MCNFATDISVIGAGPAGTATALTLLDLGFSVSLIERSNFESRRIGEHLTPDAYPTLAKLGVLDTVRSGSHLEPPIFQSVWGDNELVTHDYICNPMGGGLTLARPHFDKSLVDAFKNRGGRFYPHCKIHHIEHRKNSWKLSLQFPEHSQKLNTKFLVDATGRNAWLAKKMGEKPIRYDKLVGLAALMPATGFDTSGALLEALPEGWWYSSLLPENEVVAIFLTDSDLIKKSKKRGIAYWKQMLANSKATQARISTRKILSAHTLPAMSHSLSQPCGKGWLAVGTAALASDPLSSSGIASGLKNGVEAATVIKDYLSGKQDSLKQYRKAHAHNVSDYLDNRLNYYCTETRWPDSAFWMRRHQRDHHLTAA